MLKYLKENLQFILLILIWLIVGIFIKPLVFILIPLSFILLWKKEMYGNLLIGFFVVLIFSDSFYLGFAKDIKPFLILLLGIFFLFNQRVFYPITKISHPFIFFFIIAVLGLINSVTIAIGFQKTLSYILLFFVVPNLVMKAFREEGPQFFKRIVFFIVIILTIGLLLKIFNSEIAVSHGERFRGVFGNPNGLAMFCVLAFLLFTVIVDYFPALFSRVEKYFVYGVLLASIILSGSRNGIVCLIIFWLFSMAQKKSFIIGIVLFLFILITYQIISDNLIDILTSLDLSEYLRLDSIKQGSGRIFAWRFAWQEIQKNFFFGKGFDYDQYLFFIPEVQERLNMLNHQGHVHNVYLGFWLNFGIVGLILFFSAFIYTFIKASMKSYLALPIMYTLLFLSNFELWLLASLNPFTIQFLIIVTILIYCKREDNEIINDPALVIK